MPPAAWSVWRCETGEYGDVVRPASITNYDCGNGSPIKLNTLLSNQCNFIATAGSRIKQTSHRILWS
ncbi:Hypothetical predicted protein [Octopus vulgaris]|uniref:Uncharacterized protein n=1 Tax=Octopus vulgaris TaxID=6645 RepID=A0AA36FKF3_OCTVU|nr:Hypothetical predicted protein [Octopus vulgaris]